MKNLLNNLSKEVLMEMVANLSSNLQQTQEALMMAESHIMGQDDFIDEQSDIIYNLHNELIVADQQIAIHEAWLEEQEFIRTNDYLYQENPETEEECPEDTLTQMVHGEVDIQEISSCVQEDYTCSGCGKFKKGQAWHVERSVYPNNHYCKGCFELDEVEIPF